MTEKTKKIIFVGLSVLFVSLLLVISVSEFSQLISINILNSIPIVIFLVLRAFIGIIIIYAFYDIAKNASSTKRQLPDLT